MKSPGHAAHYFLSKFCLIFIIFSSTFSACQRKSNEETIPVPSDKQITTTIQTRFARADEVPAEDIEITTQAGIVTLEGSTDNLLAKERATEISEAVRGVLAVVNNITIASDRADEAIDRDITRALSTDAVTENREVSATVNNGLVTLKGMVDSWQERRLIENIAQGVKGVKEINNIITVQYDEVRPDEEIKNEIERALTLDSRIGSAKINVDVNEGAVTLAGSVGSALEKSLAFDIAHIAGVDSVSVDNLEVHPEYRNRMFRSDAISTLTSDQIQAAIQQALAYDPRVPESEVNVSVEGETAILSGAVKNLNAKISAGQDAMHTAGINTIKNNIEVERKVVVRPEVPTTDEAIKSRIKAAIIRDPYVEEDGIGVRVEKGIVALSGNVDSGFEKRQIQKVAGNVKGVIAINNNLEVSGNQ